MGQSSGGGGSEATVRERLGQEYGENVTAAQASAAVEAVGQIMLRDNVGAVAATNTFIRENPRRS